VRATKENQPQGNVNKLVTPEMQTQIRQLKHELDECNHRLLSHLGSLNTIFEALNTARQSAECLLTGDPFEAWEKLIEEDEWDEFLQHNRTTGAQDDSRPQREEDDYTANAATARGSHKEIGWISWLPYGVFE
jgi:hypothetical protein